MYIRRGGEQQHCEDYHFFFFPHVNYREKSAKLPTRRVSIQLLSNVGAFRNDSSSSGDYFIWIYYIAASFDV